MPRGVEDFQAVEIHGFRSPQGVARCNKCIGTEFKVGGDYACAILLKVAVEQVPDAFLFNS